jgi:BirA family biotin operon repressor/biotin-[acetyl-CoA-carboxylase] ligase
MSAIDERVLDELAHGRFVSGADIGRRLGVSRGSVRNAVGRLRADGLVVHAVYGRGYRLERSIRALDGALIRARLGDRHPFLGDRVSIHRRIESTSSWLLARADSGDLHGRLCLAEFQTGGRGRRGRSWRAAPYRHLLLSLGWALARGPAGVTGLSLAAGVAVRQVLLAIGADAVRLKWPNDLLVGAAKLGGVLVDVVGEAAGHCQVVVGVGINVEEDVTLAEGGAGTATLESVCRHALDRSRLAADVALSLAAALEQFDRSGFAPFRDDWNRAHACRGKPVTIQSGDAPPLAGVALGVDDDGALWLRDGSGMERRVVTGDVSLRWR